MEAAPGMGRFGQLSAIEVFDEIGDPRAADVLIPMLRSESQSVRDWAAQSLAALGAREAVPEIRRMYEATRREERPDWGSTTLLRDALTRLGGRHEVRPARVDQLCQTDATFDACWLPADLPEVIEELARARQAVLSFMYWMPFRDSRSFLATPGWELDWDLPWDELVESAREGALAAATRAAPPPPGTVATVDWIDESDL